MTDPIADMLTRIRNAQLAKKAEVFLPFSKIKFVIAEILQKNDYVENVEKVENKFTEIKIKLKYSPEKKPAITKLRRISKCGRRVYLGKEEMPRILNGYGISIVSTSSGVMSNAEARKAGVGGEIICEIY